MCSDSAGERPRPTLGGCDRNTTDHMPGAGNSTRPTRRKLDPDFENSVSKICFRLVDRPHDRHAIEHVLAELDELAADEVGGEEAKQRQGRERDDQARAGNMERQICLGAKADGHERPHRVIDPVDEPPGEADRDVEWPDEDQAGQKVVSDAADNARMSLGLFGLAGGFGLRILVGVAHPGIHCGRIKGLARPIRPSPTWRGCAADRRPCP